RGARFFVTAVAATLLRLRNGEDVLAKVDARRLQDKAMIERLDKYALVAVLYYVSIMRAMIGAGADLGTLLQASDSTAVIESRVNERMLEEKLAPKALDEKLPKLPGIAK